MRTTHAAVPHHLPYRACRDTREPSERPRAAAAAERHGAAGDAPAARPAAAAPTGAAAHPGEWGGGVIRVSAGCAGGGYL